MMPERQHEPSVAMLRSGQSLYHAFCATAESHPQQIAWLERSRHADAKVPWRAWTWHEVHTLVDAVAALLETHRLTPGERLVSALPNGLDWALIDLACSAVGILHAPLDLRMPSTTASAILEQLHPSAILTVDGSLQSLACVASNVRVHLNASTLRHDGLACHPSTAQQHRWRAPIDDHATACILSTSGTTGAPKGVMLSHRNLMCNAAAKLEAMPQSPDDVRLNLLPFAHAYAKTCELGLWSLAGGTMTCAIGIRQAMELARELRPTLINAVPAFYQAIVDDAGASLADIGLQPWLGDRIRRLASGGAPLSEPLRAAFAQLDQPIYQGYGLTEASPVVCSNRAATDDAPACLAGVGPAVRDTELRLDAEGRLWVQGPGVMRGYWNDPRATAAKIHDGWLDTGDHATWIDADVSGTARAASRCVPKGAAITITGRSDDVQVLNNGYKFSPAPLERILMAALPVERCILIGNHRSQPLLAVRLRADCSLSQSELLALGQAALSEAPKYCRPARVLIDRDAWTVENGLVHWKGHLLRRALEARFAFE